MHRDHYPGCSGGASQRRRNRQSGVLHALDLCRTARNYGSANDGRRWDAARRPIGRPVRRRWPAATDRARPCKTTFRKIMARGVLEGGCAALLVLLAVCSACVAAEPFPLGKGLLLEGAASGPG